MPTTPDRALDALAASLARRLPPGIDSRAYVDQEAPLLDPPTRGAVARAIDALTGPGEAFAGRDHVIPDGTFDIDLVGIGRVDPDALVDQVATVRELAARSRDELPAAADDLDGLDNLLSHLLDRCARAAGTL
jgi:hypothetical protein